MSRTTTRRATAGLVIAAALFAPATASAAEATCGAAVFGRVATPCEAPAEAAPVAEAPAAVEVVLDTPAERVATSTSSTTTTDAAKPTTRPKGEVRQAAARQTKLAESVMTWFSDYSFFRGGHPVL